MDSSDFSLPLRWLLKEPLSSSRFVCSSQAISLCVVHTQFGLLGDGRLGVISAHSHRDRIYVHVVILCSFCWRLLVTLSLWLGEWVPRWQALKGPVVIDNGKARGSSPVGKTTVR